MEKLNETQSNEKALGFAFDIVEFIESTFEKDGNVTVDELLEFIDNNNDIKEDFANEICAHYYIVDEYKDSFNDFEIINFQINNLQRIYDYLSESIISAGAQQYLKEYYEIETDLELIENDAEYLEDLLSEIKTTIERI